MIYILLTSEMRTRQVLTDAIPSSVGKELIGLVSTRDEIPNLLKVIQLSHLLKFILRALFDCDGVHVVG